MWYLQLHFLLSYIMIVAIVDILVSKKCMEQISPSNHCQRNK